MNITRENSGELTLQIKVDVVESDYAERVTKALKSYQQRATLPGFRKGKAPMGLIQRMYKNAIVAEEVQNIMGEALYKYIDDEKLNLIGSPLTNDEQTGIVDFSNQKDFTFYFDAALVPNFDIDWNRIDTKYYQIKVTSKDVDKQVTDLTNRYGNFETPEEIGTGDFVYGRAVELDKTGNAVENGVATFTSFDLSTLKDADIAASFIGKKKDEKVVFNAGKAFSPADLEKTLHLEEGTGKKFKADIEFTVSGCSHITPHEVNEELFEKVFPGEGIHETTAFRKRLTQEIEQNNNTQSDDLFVSQVRKAIMEQFTVELPAAFLKRWLLSREDQKLTAENIDTEWDNRYEQAIKWEIVDNAINNVKRVEPTQNEIVDYVKDILRRNDNRPENESDAEMEKRLEEAARTIAADRNNVSQISARIYVRNAAAFFKEQLKPESVKVSVKEFAEQYK